MSLDSPKQIVSVAVIGPVDSGKSTTMGRLVFDCGKGAVIDPRTIERYHQLVLQQRQTANNNNHNNHQDETIASCQQYAWILDTKQTERDRLTSVDLSLQHFVTPQNSYLYTVIDTPGHSDFVKNMIAGIAQADVALMVLDGRPGVFEAHMVGPTFGRNSGGSPNIQGGPIQEQLLLAHAMGVPQLIIAINKMDDDSIQYSQERFDTIRKELIPYLTHVGYTDTSKIHFVPISAYQGNNLMTTNDSPMDWYTGKSLLELFDTEITIPERLVDLPFRMPIQDVYKIGGVGTVAVGRVETGTIRTGMKVQFSPSNLIRPIRSMERHRDEMEQAFPGDNVGLNIKDVTLRDLHRGDVISNANDRPACTVRSFDAQVTLVNHPGQIQDGYCPAIHVHTKHVSCRFTKIHRTIDKTTGEVLEEDPEYVEEGDTFLVTLEPTKPVCVETFAEFPPLGRFVVRDMRRTVGFGVIQSVVKADPVEPAK